LLIEKPAYIGPLSEAPDFMSNTFLKTGYRINYFNYSLASKSFFHFHNESVNVWTHFLGAIAVFAVLIYTIFMDDKTFTENDPISVPRWPLYFSQISLIISLGSSAFYHLYNCQNSKSADFLLRVDLAGASLMIAGSTTPLFYYGFTCEPLMRLLWLLLIWITGATGIAFTFINVAPLVKGLVVLVSLIIINAGIVYIYVLQEELFMQFNCGPWFLAYLSIIFGLTLYVFAIPENFFPKTFDIIGASH